ncbi:hypothetical protein [Moorena sp. SIO3I6]|uniref:hypothetical protein n=1 Tax=Moorena sp. SIO3I6 TaxID=2607831 RepID=UPI0013FB808D|nr:hypothetical protein [Moorena sp. SIO3I6]NEP28845.1 hypothetical protein [Moorena sp. SIO3I6]
MVHYISCYRWCVTFSAIDGALHFINAPYKRCDRTNPCSLFPVPCSLLLTIYLLNLSTSKLCFHKT